jgi:hypothetical protein
MIVDLEREDLINLVKGTSPSYAVMEDKLVSLCGRYTGGHSDTWAWKFAFFVDITDKELWDMYLMCK